MRIYPGFLRFSYVDCATLLLGLIAALASLFHSVLSASCMSSALDHVPIRSAAAVSLSEASAHDAEM